MATVLMSVAKLKEMANHRGGIFTLDETRVFLDIFEKAIREGGNAFNQALTPQHLGLCYTLLARMPRQGDIAALSERIHNLIDALFATIERTKHMVAVWERLRRQFATNRDILEKVHIQYFRHVRRRTTAGELSDERTTQLLKQLQKQTKSKDLLHGIRFMVRLASKPYKLINAVLEREKKAQQDKNRIVRAHSWPAVKSPRPRSFTR